MAFCTGCGKEVPAGAVACPNCGQSMAAAPVSASAPAGGLTDNVAGALAYVTFIPAIVFLVLEPYSKNRFIRFHSFQCLFLAGALFALGIVLSIISMVPFLGLVTIPLGFALWVGTIVV